MSTARPEQPSAFGYSSLSTTTQTRSTSPATSSSPIDPSSSSASSVPSARTSYASFHATGHPGIMASNSRSGSRSPSHELGGSSRLFSKRAREIQAQEGVSGLPLNLWGGPPTSGNSTPLRENIPESPTDGFPDFGQLATPEGLPQTRRARAGTVPSRFSPGGAGNGLLGAPGLGAKSTRVTPSQSPFNKSPSPNADPSSNSTLLSRLRAGSMPQRAQFAPLPGTTSPFGPSIFSSWNPSGVRERGSTLASIASIGSNGPSSPAHSQFSKEGSGESDVHMRTLDYLGLAETPQPPRAHLATPYMPSMDYSSQSSRIRSYSVNNKDKYAAEEDEYESQYAALQSQLAATNAAIHNHNMTVQAFVNQASVPRPRAATASALYSPENRRAQIYHSGNTTVPGSATPAEVLQLQDDKDYDDLPQAIASMGLGSSSTHNAGSLAADEYSPEGATSALWLGSIPTSTTTSTLTEMFKAHGRVLSARVLTNKSCGFVNFERVESAISAKASMNGKEIFPGGGLIRINFAKPISASNTPGHDGLYPSPSPDHFAPGNDPLSAFKASGDAFMTASTGIDGAPTVPPLDVVAGDIINIAAQLGASEEDRLAISRSLQTAIRFKSFRDEIPPIREPSQSRVHDGPKLREIRKRIDNQSLSQKEIEEIAVNMLPEIVELSSDYLGNTVVQKLFDHCSEQYLDVMLAEIAPHLAEISVHKNGTWAAQKICNVCNTHSQRAMIAEHLRPYTVPLLLDQFGNYVIQCCLKYGPPYDDYIFETMVCRMWDIAQGRFGARGFRSCLESHQTSKSQQRMLAAAIAIHSPQLATDPNGALLLTWFLDTCTFPQRRTALSPHIIPHLVHLCTHKVAYLTVLKLINQKSEPSARDATLRAIFFTPSDEVLEAILSDQNCGVTFIFKVLTTPFFDESLRPQVVETVKAVLLKIAAEPKEGYKRLMDEVGLSSKANGTNREGNAHSEQRQRPGSRHANANGQHSHPTHSNNRHGGHGAPRGEPSEPNSTPFPPFNQSMMYTAPAAPMGPAMSMEQMQYQQNMMNRGGPPMNYNYAAMPGYGGYRNHGPSFEPPRQHAMTNGGLVHPTSSVIPTMPAGQASYAPPGFGINMAGYGYGGLGDAMSNVGYMQPANMHPRRGRR